MSTIRVFDDVNDGIESGDSVFGVGSRIYRRDESLGTTSAVKNPDMFITDRNGFLVVSNKDEESARIGDTNVFMPFDGDVLMFINGEWVNTPLVVPETLEALTDTNISSPQEGDVLMFNNGEWVNASLEGLTFENPQLTGEISLDGIVSGVAMGEDFTIDDSQMTMGDTKFHQTLTVMKNPWRDSDTWGTSAPRIVLSLTLPPGSWDVTYNAVLATENSGWYLTALSFVTSSANFSQRRYLVHSACQMHQSGITTSFSGGSLITIVNQPRTIHLIARSSTSSLLFRASNTGITNDLWGDSYAIMKARALPNLNSYLRSPLQVADSSTSSGTWDGQILQTLMTVDIPSGTSILLYDFTLRMNQDVMIFFVEDAANITQANMHINFRALRDTPRRFARSSIHAVGKKVSGISLVQLPYGKRYRLMTSGTGTGISGDIHNPDESTNVMVIPIDDRPRLQEDEYLGYNFAASMGSIIDPPHKKMIWEPENPNQTTWTGRDFITTINMTIDPGRYLIHVSGNVRCQSGGRAFLIVPTISDSPPIDVDSLTELNSLRQGIVVHTSVGSRDAFNSTVYIDIEESKTFRVLIAREAENTQSIQDENVTYTPGDPPGLSNFFTKSRVAANVFKLPSVANVIPELAYKNREVYTMTVTSGDFGGLIETNIYLSLLGTMSAPAGRYMVLFSGFLRLISTDRRFGFFLRPMGDEFDSVIGTPGCSYAGIADAANEWRSTGISAAFFADFSGGELELIMDVQVPSSPDDDDIFDIPNAHLSVVMTRIA